MNSENWSTTQHWQIMDKILYYRGAQHAACGPWKAGHHRKKCQFWPKGVCQTCSMSQKYVQNAFPARALPRTPLGELTMLPQTL